MYTQKQADKSSNQRQYRQSTRIVLKNRGELAGTSFGKILAQVPASAENRELQQSTAKTSTLRRKGPAANPNDRYGDGGTEFSIDANIESRYRAMQPFPIELRKAAEILTGLAGLRQQGRKRERVQNQIRSQQIENQHVLVPIEKPPTIPNTDHTNNLCVNIAGGTAPGNAKGGTGWEPRQERHKT